jgi:hypothetical protein
MTEQLRSDSNYNMNNDNEKQQFNGSFSKNNKVGMKSISKKKREDKENYYIIDEFREE